VAREKGMRILVVEDDDGDAAIFLRYMEKMRKPVSATRAATMGEAKSLLSSKEFDLVFLDLMLPEGNGLDLLAHLSENGSDVPVVIVTGSGDETKAVEAMKAGAYDYLVKENLSTAVLEQTIRYARRRHNLEQDRQRMVEKLARLSVTDELTGVANRRAFMEKLQEELQRSERTKQPFAVLMVDMDRFKEVNDRYGHQAGDEALKRCAAALRRNVRRTDFVARYGGEEFCIILPETETVGARRVAANLRESVKQLPPPMPTVSVGVASWEPDITLDELMHRADEAMYGAKRAGRDCVAVYGSPVAGEGAPADN